MLQECCCVASLGDWFGDSPVATGRIGKMHACGVMFDLRLWWLIRIFVGFDIRFGKLIRMFFVAFGQSGFCGLFWYVLFFVCWVGWCMRPLLFWTCQWSARFLIF